MTKTVTRRPKAGIVGKFVQFLGLQHEQAELKKRVEALKKELSTFADDNGVVDDEMGHLVYDLDEPVDTPKGRYRGFMRQRRVSNVFNEDKGEKFLRRKGLYDQCLSTYLDQDKVARLYADDKITEKEWDALFDSNETWAFVPVKD